MDSTRQNKISRLIQKELSDIFLKMAKETRGIMVSVSVVRVSPDLGIAKAYLSVFPSERGGEVIEHLTNNTKAIRYELGNRVRHQLRIIPELRFYLDDSLDYIEHIDNLLKD
ncbi:MAG: 30S ribosome-binding factor RbfA [Bacteroidaceae bacterium]|nr:30S ribosome-binding factor RbfA [Bacteroidaceae bacterium]